MSAVKGKDTYNNSLDNLIILCPSCHRKEEMSIVKRLKYKEGESFCQLD